MGPQTNFRLIWIARDYSKCSGCRNCEIACSLFHEKKIWPEASRIRVFMTVPGVEFPHFCAQCEDHPCLTECPTEAIIINERTKSIDVKKDLCNGCGICTEICPGHIPHMHPKEKYALICDLCDGEPQCVEVCKEGGWEALRAVECDLSYGESNSYKLYAQTPEQITKDLAILIYGEAGEEMVR